MLLAGEYGNIIPKGSEAYRAQDREAFQVALRDNFGTEASGRNGW